MARVYRNISAPILVFGLELPDIGLVLVVFFVLFNFSSSILFNLASLIFLTAVLRFLKKGKPANFSIHLFRFLLSSPRLGVQIENRLLFSPSHDKSNHNKTTN